MPTPETTLVVHILPGPTPTFTASAPAFIKSCAAFAVTILPPIKSRVGKLLLISAMVSKTPCECP